MDISDWKVKIFIFFNIVNVKKKNVKFLNFEPIVSSSNKNEKNFNKLGSEQKRKPLGNSYKLNYTATEGRPSCD